ncbi:unnamed protein product [Kuraishia capsulata CBS 1993]|uniref:Transcriptional regulatory protein DEP1 n=1 Tax=Kuraishia capsulata CBS 1993 TaxID=1382522 RepID=W6MS63_9ASCO|nr:uncharacterized protein KUCA_T00000626001 [Kuraishia capsulata CBS 1993]CDK24660.1 unnamed protein product [Kuraishia capsulata CBS 1993]
MSISDKAQEISREQTPNTDIPSSSPLKKEIAESSSELSDINSSEVETDLMEDIIDSDLQRMATLDGDSNSNSNAIEEDDDDDTFVKNESDSAVESRKRRNLDGESDQKRRKLSDSKPDEDVDEDPSNDKEQGSKEEEEDDEEEQAEALEGDNDDEEEKEKLRAVALADLTDIEVGFAELKDSIFQNQLSRLQFELELCVNGSHPEFINFVSIINKNYEKRLSYITNSQRYQLKCIDDQTNAQRAQVHQQFIKNCQDLKTEYLWETTSEWYDINEERRKLDNKVLDIPDYYQFNPMLSTRDENDVIPELVSQRNGLLLEISQLKGLQKYVGFPSALYDLRSARKADIDKDLLEMGIRK